MQNSVLEILITAKDEASAKLQGFSQKVNDLQPAFRGMALAGGVAFAAIVGFANESIKAANEAEDIQTQLGAVLKSTGGIAGVTKDSAIALSKALEQNTKFSDEAVLSTENLLLTFTKIGKDTMPQATETVLNMATALGEDTKSAAIQLGKALQDPVLGISALRRVGVNFTEDQKKVIKHLVETGHSLEAQKLILKELNTEFGGSAAAAATTYAGRMEQIKNQVNDAQEVIGNALLPVLGQLMTALLPIIKSITDWVTKHPELVKWILITAGVVAGFVLLIGTLGIIIGAVTAAFASVAAIIVTSVVVAIGLLIAATIMIIAKWSEISGFFKGIWEDIKKVFKEGVDALISYFQPLIDTINKIGSMLSNVGSSIKGTVSGAISAVTGFVTGKHAQGGNVMSGSTYLVGERGPEYFTPSSGGSIIPNGRGGGGGNVTVNINGGTYLSERVAKEIGDKIITQFLRLNRA